MKVRVLFLSGAAAFALSLGLVGFPAGTANANPSGPATRACAPVTRVMQMMKERGMDTTSFYDNVVSKLCPL